MDSWERFDDTSSSDKEAFYSSLNMEDITDVEYRNAKIALKSYMLIIKIYVFIVICMFRVIHYCLQMYLRILEINALKHINLILLIFCLHLD